MKGELKSLATLGALLALLPVLVWAEEVQVEMHKVTDQGTEASIGQITIREVEGGLAFYPKLTELSPGLHGFHVHEKGDCGAKAADGKRGPALAAGGHFDPDKAGVHKAPWEDGHRGDLPALYVNDNKRAEHPLFVAGLKLADVQKRALVIHEGGDNYADEPKPLGGGGARIACGVIGG